MITIAIHCQIRKKKKLPNAKLFYLYDSITFHRETRTFLLQLKEKNMFPLLECLLSLLVFGCPNHQYNKKK